ncbi:uroporphyrinogen decarboxylase family protein [Desulfoluna sp.]|uniref:uroporphyrinogen decarboxylase family protein n=1 Tax=Desulfoluna sp. TaxID=2045199 RepID=UPI002610CE74|nr:uroporphyrinogen decarboxylase family protein [Desulfoluna sp.]
MNPGPEFRCTHPGTEEIPEALIDELGFKVPEIHTDTREMARLALALKKDRGDGLCRLPFCMTVEAEAMGAQITLGNKRNGPRVAGYCLPDIDAAMGIQRIDLSQGRALAVLDCVADLSTQGEAVGLNIHGPFTLASSLIDPRHLYKGMRQKSEAVDHLMRVIEASIVAYALEGIKRGAQLLSYADPAGAMDLIGPKLYKEVSGKITARILQKIEASNENTLLHLCGKTSTALEKCGLSSSEPVPYDPELTYGEALTAFLKQQPGVSIVGHSCMKQTPKHNRHPRLWAIHLGS